MIRVAALFVSWAALSSCSAVPTEQQLIGTWRMPVRTYYEHQSEEVVGYSKQVAVTTVRPDHTYTAIHEGEREVTIGHWRLSGRWLVYEFTTRDKGRRVMERRRNKIVELSDRKLVVLNSDGGTAEWTKVR